MNNENPEAPKPKMVEPTQKSGRFYPKTGPYDEVFESGLRMLNDDTGSEPCADAELERLRQELAEAKKAILVLNAQIKGATEEQAINAARFKWGIKNARWIRHEHEAYVAIPVARDADLSCPAMREDAIDKAMRET